MERRCPRGQSGVRVTPHVDPSSVGFPEAGGGVGMHQAFPASPGSFVGAPDRPGAGELTVRESGDVDAACVPQC